MAPNTENRTVALERAEDFLAASAGLGGPTAAIKQLSDLRISVGSGLRRRLAMRLIREGHSSRGRDGNGRASEALQGRLRPPTLQAGQPYRRSLASHHQIRGRLAAPEEALARNDRMRAAPNLMRRTRRCDHSQYREAAGIARQIKKPQPWAGASLGHETPSR